MDTKKYADIFGEYEFLSKDHLDLFIHTMNEDTAIHCLISAVKSAYDRGAYTIGEVELISRGIRILAEPKEKNDQ